MKWYKLLLLSLISGLLFGFSWYPHGLPFLIFFALIPLLFGALKDAVGSQSAYWICLPFYLLIMYYAYRGYKIRTK